MPIRTQPENLLQGVVLVLVPHFDDEILGCGGMLAMLPAKERIHLVFATAGDSLPIATQRESSMPATIGQIRKQESLAALAHIGIPANHLFFLDLPEKHLTAEQARLTDEIAGIIQRVRPNIILVPFRFDQHPDHLALASAGRRAAATHAPDAAIMEYFVYVNYPLLPRKDIRRYCQPDLLYEMDISPAAEMKKQALNLFTSQTTIFYPDQCRPVLSPELVATYAAGPEYLLRCPPERNPCTLPAVFLQAIQYLQPRLKRIKEYLRFRLSKKNQIGR